MKGKMKLTILGSGTCIPSKDRNPPGYLIEAGKEFLLLDSGSGTLQQIARAGIDFMKINHVFYSHLHPDHIADMIPILQAMYVNVKYFGKKKGRTSLYGPAGFGEFYRKIKEAASPSEPYAVRVSEVTKVTLDGMKITAMPVSHAGNSIGYRIKHNGKILAYSGDTGPCESLIKLCKGADVAVLECSFPSSVKGHMNAVQCGEIAEKAGVKTLVLSHLYPSWKGRDPKMECRKRFSGRIIVAKDLMKVEI